MLIIIVARAIRVVMLLLLNDMHSRRAVDHSGQQGGGEAGRIRRQQTRDGKVEGGFDAVHGKDALANVVVGVKGVLDHQSRTRHGQVKVAAALGLGSERDAHFVKVELSAKEGEKVNQQGAEAIARRSVELEEADNHEHQTVRADASRVGIVQRALRQKLLQHQGKRTQSGITLDEELHQMNRLSTSVDHMRGRRSRRWMVWMMTEVAIVIISIVVVVVVGTERVAHRITSSDGNDTLFLLRMMVMMFKCSMRTGTVKFSIATDHNRWNEGFCFSRW